MVESEFAKIANHKNKFIYELTFGQNTGIKWQTTFQDIDGEPHLNTASIDCSEPARDKFNESVYKLKDFIVEYFIKNADKKVKENWLRRLFITKISFANKPNAQTAKINAVYYDEHDKKCALNFPAIELYDKEIVNHLNGSAVTYGEYYTNIFDEIVNEAKIYLSGERGAMQKELEETKQEA